MRKSIIHYLALLLGVRVKIDEISYGARLSEPAESRP